jgi:hypothetical protein
VVFHIIYKINHIQPYLKTWKALIFYIIKEFIFYIFYVYIYSISTISVSVVISAYYLLSLLKFELQKARVLNS